jgi:uncharacterized protein
MRITASKLYNYIQCPHRVWRDIYGPQEEKIKETNPFVQLLWDRGVQHEEKVINKIGKFTDLSKGDFDERFERTIKAIEAEKELIYQGVLKYDNLVGIPDLLKRLPDGNYIPIDIKAGRGYEGVSEDDEGKPKKHYAAQLCFYVELLKQLGFAKENKGLILDIDENKIKYSLDERIGPKTPQSWWEYYEELKEEVGALINNKKQNLPAHSGVCKLCPWFNSCKNWCKENDDLTNIFYLGRSKRDVIAADLGVNKVKDFCNVNIDEAIQLKEGNKKFLAGVGKKTLEKQIIRANIISNIKKPIIHKAIELPKVAVELFFDIEADPTQNLVYLHGVYERRGNKEKFIYFLAKNNTAEAEKQAWQEFWDYIKTLPKNDYAVYYYSAYEKTTYKKMRKQYLDVIPEDDLESFFDNSKVIDLYKVVLKNTDWPLASYSIKDIAVYLGFKWRDKSPSGALSIQWYNEYLKTNDEKIIKRILDYNEDDCKATMVLKDFLVKR